MKKLLAYVSWFFLIFGVAGLLAVINSVYQADRGGAIPAESKLTALVGKVTKAAEVTRTRKGSTVDNYYELTVQLADKSVQTWRVTTDTPKSVVTDAIDETVEAKIDSNGHNTVYALTVNNKVAISYAVLAASAKKKADNTKATLTSPRMLSFLGLSAFLGGLGVLMHRRMRNPSLPSV